jgi:hypothetical protein
VADRLGAADSQIDPGRERNPASPDGRRRSEGNASDQAGQGRDLLRGPGQFDPAVTQDGYPVG